MRGCTSCTVDNALIPSAQSSVTNVYRARLPTNKDAIIRLTWSRDRAGPSLSVAINNKPIINPTDSTKGSCSCIFANSILGLCWDFSAAKYNLGPEPISDFYVVLIFDKKIALLVGDKNFSKGAANSVADFSMVSRTVQVVGRTIYSTRARFYDEGKEHEITIRFQGELELSMHVDEKKVLHVRRLRWNFRGNDTVFVDGLAVDVMWDLFGWLFQDPTGCAVVLMRTRATTKSRLWMLEEEWGERDEGVCEGFSLVIQVS